jgi:hypothetical protein
LSSYLEFEFAVFKPLQINSLEIVFRCQANRSALLLAMDLRINPIAVPQEFK